MADIERLKHGIHEHEANLLKELRLIRRGLRRATGGQVPPELTVGQKIADAVAATMGSWPFIIVQSLLLSKHLQAYGLMPPTQARRRWAAW